MSKKKGKNSNYQTEKVTVDDTKYTNHRIAAIIVSAAMLVIAIIYCMSQSLFTPTDIKTEQPAQESILSMYPEADMGAYERVNNSENHVYREMEPLDVINEYDNGSSFVVTFGYSGCGSCQRAYPVLEKLATEYGTPIAYVNTRKNPEWASNFDIDHFDELEARFGEHFVTNTEGRQQMMVPFVMFIKDGTVVQSFIDLPDNYVYSTGLMTEEQEKELSDTYREGFEKMFGDEKK